MRKVVHPFSTEVLLSDQEAKDICKLGQGEKCCAFLVMSSKHGFECIRMSYPTNATIFERLRKGTMNAKGEGGWHKCPWEAKLNEEPPKTIQPLMSQWTFEGKSLTTNEANRMRKDVAHYVADVKMLTIRRKE